MRALVRQPMTPVYTKSAAVTSDDNRDITSISNVVACVSALSQRQPA